MRRLLKIALVLVLMLVGGAGYFLWRVTPRIPDRPFTRPTGPLPVGTREFDWTDSARAESYTRNPDDRRRVVVQVWYPTTAGAPGDSARYLLRREEFASRLGGWAARKARTNAVLDAPIARPDSGGYPVLLYNHGGAWTRWSATFAAEELASHGYVVFSVEHFGFNQTARFPDGTPFAADTLAFPKEQGDPKGDALRAWAYLDDPVFKIWAADARFVLDRIEALAREPGPWQGAIDTSRIGAYGWSFGGALAVELAGVDPRVKAAVDHDGQLFGAAREAAVTRPVLQLHHGIDDALTVKEKERDAARELIAMTEGWDSTARARSTADWFTVKIDGTDHGDFSDLSLFYPRGKERLDPRRAHEIINRYTLAFFDRYLRGLPGELLTQDPPPWPGVTVTRLLRAAPDSTAAAAGAGTARRG